MHSNASDNILLDLLKEKCANYSHSWKMKRNITARSLLRQILLKKNKQKTIHFATCNMCCSVLILAVRFSWPAHVQSCLYIIVFFVGFLLRIIVVVDFWFAFVCMSTVMALRSWISQHFGCVWLSNFSDKFYFRFPFVEIAQFYKLFIRTFWYNKIQRAYGHGKVHLNL